MIDCSVPLGVPGVIIDPFNNTKFGALITFHCEESNNSMLSVCDSDGEWDPDPSHLNCPTATTGTQCLIMPGLDFQLLII